MKTLVSFVLCASSSVLIFAYPKEGYFISPDVAGCELQDDVLVCDFRNKGKSYVHYEDPANSSITCTAIFNAHEVLLRIPLCKNLELHNITKIDVVQEELIPYLSGCYGKCEKGGKLSTYNSDLAIIPFGLRELYIKDSTVDFLGPYVAREYAIHHSHVKTLNITGYTGSGQSGLIYNSTIDDLVSLKIDPNYTVFIQNSQIDHIYQRAILVQGGNLILDNTSVMLVHNGSVLLTASSTIELNRFEGSLGLKTLPHKDYFTEFFSWNSHHNTPSANQEHAVNVYFKAFVSFLVLFIIMVLLFLLQVVVKRRMIIHTISSTFTDPHIVMVPHRQIVSHTVPLLPDNTDKSQCSSDVVDDFEDELLKLYDITKALYLEDMDDIKSEMQAALDTRNKEEFDEFVMENIKLLELRDLQSKRRSKADKHTALMERINHTIRQLIEKQYHNHSFSLQNCGNDLKLKYKDIIVECNKRLVEDLTEMIKMTIIKWDDELQEEKNKSPDLIYFVRNLLSKSLESVNQLAEKLERFILQCNEEHEIILSDLETSYKAKVGAINACAEERSDLVKRTEEEDAEVYGRDKALRLSLIQEEISFASRELRQKEALLEFSQVNQKSVLQEKIINHQTDNIKHLERIIMTLSDIRSCYVLSAGSSQHTSIIQERRL